MSKPPNQKLRILRLERLLLERSDEENPLTVQQIIAALGAAGITADRKTIYDDITVLEQMGMDIITVRGRSNAYYVGQRAFELPELKLLVDVVQSAQFITPAKSGRLIAKLTALSSRGQARQLARQVYVAGRAKTANEGIYYNVDAIHAALLANRQISFRYFEWAVDTALPRLFGKRFRRAGARYLLSPWALSWDDENYYLIGYDTEAARIKHYRVDKMEGIRVLDTARDGQSLFDEFDIARYTRMTFGMFGGEPVNVRLKFANRLIGVVADRFGGDITVHPAGDDTFTVNVEVATSPQFTAWLLSFGPDAELLSPQWLREALTKELRDIAQLYNASAL